MRDSAGWGNTAQGRYSASTRLEKDLRVWNREEYVRLERDSFSVFVDRLPCDISKRELFDRFSWTGRINDIYLSRKMRNGVVYLFAFIRYTTKGGALKAVAEMNHLRIRGSEIFVGEAKYRRDESKGRGAIVEGMAGSRIQPKQQGVNVGKEMRAGDLMSSEHRSHGVGRMPLVNSAPTPAEGPLLVERRGLEISVSKDNLEWLNRSVVGSATRAFNVRSLSESVRKVWPQVVKICDMGKYKALLIFDSVQSAEEALESSGDGIPQIFHQVCRWKERERCDKRRVWLTCYGVPLHAWTVETFCAIGGQWGEVIEVDAATRSATSFWARRVLVDTWRLETISDSLRLTVGSGGFDVHVTELGEDAWEP
ncbi:uncharacterized protein LOC130946198 [Arachis stenosperma]|uniref:uncharacterized protein LOC130946198 n=1 Tax=Arachis stenosperma TaxID=217475 RepID=UPI0025AD48E5|nr:uncharacterized protein LOC130946198 [Arachis stenosperma]